MERASRLPSGAWRIRVNDGGVRKSFTGKTKAEVERMACEYVSQLTVDSQPTLTLAEAMDTYIMSRENVLSPSTIREYARMRQKSYDMLLTRNIDQISELDVQRWINAYAAEHSPKSVKNAFGFLNSVMKQNRVDYVTEYSTLPQAKKVRQYVPSDNDVKTLLSEVRGTQLESAIYLAAFIPARRGEICALLKRDIDGDMVTINKSMVKTKDDTFVIKAPKSYAGYRTVQIPLQMADRIKELSGTDRIYEHTPDYLTKSFLRITHRLGMPQIHLHSLRHYSASILHYMGISDQTIISRGGWSTPHIMQEIYRGEITDEMEKQNKIINAHFTGFVTN